MLRLYAQFLAFVAALVSAVACLAAAAYGTGPHWGVVAVSVSVLWAVAFLLDLTDSV